VSLHTPPDTINGVDSHLGMGGLACALALAKEGFTNIDVYETASNLGFVGAGIQLAPNMARILDRLGCWADIEKDAVDLLETSIRRRLKFLSLVRIH
jgi:salicylate hydroxylase